MCGIAGFVNYSDDFSLSNTKLDYFSSFLKYRGPNQNGKLLEKIGPAFLSISHYRLSIIDTLERGKQPMESFSKQTIICYNGEIYNYKKLRKELSNKGFQFNTETDTEVILNLYECYGIKKTLAKLEGMFVFYLFDKISKKSFLCRDIYGQKPVYYYNNKKEFGFSSDIRSFSVYPANLQINHHALGYYFQELSTPINDSIWEGIHKLEPGSYIEFNKNGKLNKEQYWNATFPNKKGDSSEKTLVSDIDSLLHKSIEKRLTADVPVGTFLSGGLDSSLITAIASKYKENIETFSVGFTYEKYNELPYARYVSDKYKTNHNEIIIKPKDTDIANDLILEFGEPFADSSMIPTYYVSKFAKTKVSVALSGDGGDEMFCGYPTYIHAKRLLNWQKYNCLKPFVKPFRNFNKVDYLYKVLNKSIDVQAEVLNRNMGFSKNEMARIFDNDKIVNACNKEHLKIIKESQKNTHNLFDSIMYSSLKTRLVNDYLVKVDRSSMYNSLEVRSPFLDKDIFNKITTIPSNILLKKEEGKYLLKKVAEKYFDKSFIYRAKKGFGIPVGEWFRNELKEEFMFVLSRKQTLVDMNYKEVYKIVDAHMKGEDHSHKMWALYVFHKWCFSIALI